MMQDIQYAWKHAEMYQGQVVLVVSPDQYQSAQQALVAYAGAQHPFSGRTVRLATGGQIAVASSHEEVFFTGAFAVLFVGVLDVQEMTRWKNAARQVLVRGM